MRHIRSHFCATTITVNQNTSEVWPISRELNDDSVELTGSRGRKEAGCEKGKAQNKEPQQAQQSQFTVQSALRKLVSTSGKSVQRERRRGGGKQGD